MKQKPEAPEWLIMLMALDAAISLPIVAIKPNSPCHLRIKKIISDEEKKYKKVKRGL
jgi:hypothetical protein